MKTAILSVFTLLSICMAAQTSGTPVGTWEGESVCQVPKPCTTEHVIYEIKDAEPGKVTIKADKVVNGQREWMGDLTCAWSAKDQKLSCPMETRKPGDWVFTLKGDALTGTLVSRDDHKLIRKISVKQRDR